MKSFLELREKAVSQQQQKLMGLALAYKRGEVSDDEVSDQVRKMADSMSMKDLEDFAKTKHKGLPKKVDEYGGPPISRKDYLKQKPMKENVEDEMPASPDEKSMALKQAEFIQYVGREIGEHLVANKEFPEWMQNKLSALHQKAKDMHATLGAHGGDMKEEVELHENFIRSLRQVADKLGLDGIAWKLLDMEKDKAAEKIKQSDIDGFVKDAEEAYPMIKTTYQRYYKSLINKLKKAKGREALDMMQEIARYISKIQSTKKMRAEEVELDEMRQPFVVVNTADGNRVVAMASDEKSAKSSIASSERPPMNIKDKSTLKIVKTFKKQNIGMPLKEEVELDEAKADFIRLSFNSPADVKKAVKWMKDNLPGANQGFSGMDASGKDIEFEDVDDAEGLMSKLKKAGFRFKVDHRESVNEAKMSVGDTVRINPKSKNIVDRKKLGKSGYIKSVRGQDYLVKFADGSSVLAQASDLEMVKEEVGPSKNFWDIRESSRNARSDARSAMRDDPDMKQKFSKDVSATDDDRKAADKNIIVQLRRVSDLSKGGEIEFKDGKKAKVSQQDAKKMLRGFDSLVKGPDKERFQNMAGKDLASMKRVLGMIKR